MMYNTTRRQELSTLDVLWAFYLSQPKRVRQAFRSRIEQQDAEAETEALWQQDLRSIKALKENWDEQGAPRINRQAISKTNKLMKSLDKELSATIRLYPTPLGAVMLKFETKKGRIKCEMGDMQMSYFVKCPDRSTEHHSFETIDKEHLNILKENLKKLM